MSLAQVANRFVEDEGNVYALYEEGWSTVNSFFNKLWNRMQNEQYKFINMDVDGNLSIPPDTSDLHLDKHSTVRETFMLAVHHMILNKKCDLDCLDDATWEYLRKQMLNRGLMYRN